MGLRNILGPFKPESSVNKVDGHLFCWNFIVVRDDYTMAHITLNFSAKKRKWYVISSVESRVSNGGKWLAPARMVDKHAFFGETALKSVDDRPIRDCLRDKLPPEELAKATAALLMGGRP